MARRKRQSSRTVVTEIERKPSRISSGLIISIIAAILLGGIPFIVGKYIELNSPGPFDSGAYVYSAKHLLGGAKMGVDEQPSARPDTLIMNIIGVKLLGFNDTGPKIIQMLLQSAAFIFVFLTLRKVFGSIAAVVGVAIAGVYLSAPIITKYGNVKEQFMIAFMIYAACSFLWYEMTNKKVWLVLSGFSALQPYYFKPTGMSVVFALIFYILVSRAVSRKWKTLWIELFLFLCGYIVGHVIPASLYLWQDLLKPFLRTFTPMITMFGAGILILTAIPWGLYTLGEKKNITSIKKIPYWFWVAGIAVLFVIAAVTQWNRILTLAGLKGGGYLADSISARGLAELAPQVFRYYKALSVPVLMSLSSIFIAAAAGLRARLKKQSLNDIQSNVVWMAAIWWILDMAFIWVSPRSYEQYYLPLCGSAAVLSGYAVWAWQQRFMQSRKKLPWLAGGITAAITLGCLSIPIFIGQRYSPDTGADYIEMYGHRMRGFGPDLKEVPGRKRSAWTAVGDYIREHSAENDKIYVWGWFPGIYVRAQRLSPVPKASEGNMHVTPPDVLARQINGMVDAMQKNPPKFIVDSRKQHFPNDRPPLELWPHQYAQNNLNGGQPIPNSPTVIEEYDRLYKQLLEGTFDLNDTSNNYLLVTTGWPRMAPWDKAMPDEAQRYEAMKPFRDFVMNNYRIVGQYGIHVVFERK